jgi:hypothetical protein
MPAPKQTLLVDTQTSRQIADPYATPQPPPLGNRFFKTGTWRAYSSFIVAE